MNTSIQQLLRELYQSKRAFSLNVFALERDMAVSVAREGELCGECERLDLSTGNVGLVARTGRLHETSDVRSDPSYKSCSSAVRSEIVVPVLWREKVVGVVDAEFTGTGDPLIASGGHPAIRRPDCAAPRSMTTGLDPCCRVAREKFRERKSRTMLYRYTGNIVQ